MWGQLTDLLLGLAGAGIVLTALYFFIVMAQQHKADDDDETIPQPQAIELEHEAITLGEGEAPSAPTQRFIPGSIPSVAALYICAKAGSAMRRVSAVEAVDGHGLQGDRHFLNRGHWSESDECEVTMIAQEDLNQAMLESGITLRDGRHRRNIVASGIDLSSLIGRGGIGVHCFNSGSIREGDPIEILDLSLRTLLLRRRRSRGTDDESSEPQ